jgi:hypothetical protein
MGKCDPHWFRYFVMRLCTSKCIRPRVQNAWLGSRRIHQRFIQNGWLHRPARAHYPIHPRPRRLLGGPIIRQYHGGCSKRWDIARQTYSLFTHDPRSRTGVGVGHAEVYGPRELVRHRERPITVTSRTLLSHDEFESKMRRRRESCGAFCS